MGMRFEILGHISGHPVPDCDVDNFADMKIGDVSLIAYIIGNPVKVIDMVPDEYVWLTEKAIPRLQVSVQSVTGWL